MYIGCVFNFFIYIYIYLNTCRKYGEIFEAIHMQEVGAEEQMLYARLVARSASSIGVVLGGQRKARFSINGKHVWARKYIKKHPKSPLITTTATTSSATN